MISLRHIGFGSALLVLGWARADEAATNAAPAASRPMMAASLVEKATSDAAEGKLDLASSEASAALGLDPRNAAALDLRGSIYVQENLWDRAERDYTTLQRISPDPAYEYKLAQIKYLEREFDDARPLFASIQNDPRLGDLARFRVFMCDLFGGHETTAARDLETMDKTGTQPSFYFGRAAWASVHNQGAAANRLVAQAAGKFGDAVISHYLEAFSEVRMVHPQITSFATKDGRRFDRARIFLEQDGLRVSTQGGWVTIPLSQLPDDLSPFPDDMREQITFRLSEASSAQSTAAPLLSFRTKSGQTYSQVRWMLDDSGLLVLTPEGWKSVAYSDLPGDLSAFPAEVRKQLAARRTEAASATTQTCTVSFTTKHGKTFTDVRAWLDDGDVSLLTADGGTTVALADLPDDLSSFPADWQKQIKARLKFQPDDGNAAVDLTFTTQRGVTYRDVRATLSSDGVMMVTPDGWTTVPLTDLPADLSAFPAAWRQRIAGWLKSQPGDASAIQVVSFATKRGAHYDQVRASLDDKGLDVLGPDGWVEVTYDQLPNDLSAFPASWRGTISARQKAASKNPVKLEP